jgi:ribosomal protein S18 acetylase RimI-like enzyme
VDIRRLQPGDEDLVVEAGGLFDHAPLPYAVAKFLAADGHHLLVAYEDGVAAGFASGVELTHPDKGTEMFLYELAVDHVYRRRGIAKALVERLAELAQDRGCYGMWALTDDDSAAALATYRSAGAEVTEHPVLFAWEFAPPHR